MTKRNRAGAVRGTRSQAAARKPAAKKQPPKRREKYSQAQIIAALEASAGIISAAARMLRCDRKTITNYINRYPEVAAAHIAVEEERADIAETALLRMMTDDRNPSLQLQASIFYLRCKGKSRGYTFRAEVTGKDGKPIETKREPLPFDLDALEPHEIEALDAMLSKAAPT